MLKIEAVLVPETASFKPKIYFMKRTSIFFIALITFSCDKPSENLYEIDPRTFVENKITLSDLADDIKYIPIDNGFPIGFTYKLIITHDYIYLSTKNLGIVKFDRDGNFIQKFGKRGRGPGEYLYGFNFAVDEITKNVFVLDAENKARIFVYSQNGTFLRHFLLGEFDDGSGCWNSDIEIFNSLLYLPNSLGQGNSKYSWLFLDTLGKLVAKKENSVPLFQTNSGRYAIIYKFENKLHYYNYFNDSIFSISPNLSYTAKFTFAKGDHRWPRRNLDISTISNFISQLIKLFQPGNMFETTHFIVLPYVYQQKSVVAFINKKTKKTFLALKNEQLPERNEKSSGCIINDLDGGLPLENLGYYTENNEEYITSLIEPIKLKSYVSTNEFGDAVAKYPVLKKELQSLANTIKETDNPILVIVRLKK